MATKSVPSHSQAETSPLPEGKSPIQPAAAASGELPKSPRGRPPKQTGEKSSYAHVVLPERVMQSLDLTHPKRESGVDAPGPDATSDDTPDNESQRIELANKLSEIKAEPDAYAYYWQLVFSASFYQLRDRVVLDKTLDESSDTSRSFPVRQVAQAAGLEYHNLKNLFTGRGTLRHLHDYQLFLYTQGIDFTQLQFNTQLIDKAYFYLVCLRQPEISAEMVAKLFF